MPRLSEDQIISFVKAHSREPQREIFARWLATAPTPQALQELAERAPDRWAQGASIMSALAGYNPKLELEGSVIHRIDSLSDSELEARIAALDSSQCLLDSQSNGYTLDFIDVSPENPPVSE